MIDIDLFKKVNDTHGHMAGNYVLNGVAQRIASAIRDEDILARYGGEEKENVIPHDFEVTAGKMSFPRAASPSSLTIALPSLHHRSIIEAATRGLQGKSTASPNETSISCTRQIFCKHLALHRTVQGKRLDVPSGGH